MRGILENKGIGEYIGVFKGYAQNCAIPLYLILFGGGFFRYQNM